MAKDIPLEKDWRHWKEKYEMAEQQHRAEIEEWRRCLSQFQKHCLILGIALDKAMSGR